MIEFKQWDSYWNNFNNWDEALLSDSNRPRDEFGLRIKPWMQSDKWDWREANKNIYLQQAIYKNAALITGTADWQTLYPSLFDFKKEYTASDFSFVDSYATATWVSLSSSAWAKDRKAELFGSSSIQLKDWLVYLGEAWSYVIQAYADFFYPSWYNSSTSYQYKEYVYLYSYDKKSDEWTVWVRNQARACATVDWLNTLFVWYLDKWLYLTVWVAHTYTANPVLCSASLNVYRLS